MTATIEPPRTRTSVVHDLHAARRCAEAMERMIAASGFAPKGRRPGRPIRCPKSGAHRHGDEHASCLVKTKNGGLRCMACGLDVGLLDAGALLGYGATAAEVAKRLDEEFRGKDGGVVEGKNIAAAAVRDDIPPEAWEKDHASRVELWNRCGDQETGRLCAARRLDWLGTKTLGAGVGCRGTRTTVGFLVEGPDLAPCGIWERDGRRGKEGRGKSVAGGHVGVIGLSAAIRRYDERVAAGFDAVLGGFEGESDLTAAVGTIMAEGDISPICAFGVTGASVAERKMYVYAAVIGARRVAFFLDDDEEGRKAAKGAAEALAATAAEVRVVTLPLTDEERARVDEDGRRTAKDVRYLLDADRGLGPGDLYAAFLVSPVFAKELPHSEGVSPDEERPQSDAISTDAAAAGSSGPNARGERSEKIETSAVAAAPAVAPRPRSIRLPEPRRDVDLVPGTFTDVGAAERLVRLYHGLVIHVVGVGWHVFTGARFERVETDVLIYMATVLARRLYAAASKIKKEEHREKIARFALSLESEARLRAAVNLVRTLPGVSVPTSAIDADPDVLNTSEGVLDLRTLRVRPHDPADLFTKVAPVAFEPDAVAPTFERFLADVTCGDEETARYVQLASGYSSTGHTREHALFIMNGAGNNGKTTLGELLRDALGDYARNADIATFTSNRADAGPRPDVARLLGARFVTALEGGEGQRLDEQLVKQLTGGDTITARHLYKDAIEFRPTFKIWFATNHRPKVRGTDNGIWRRLRLVPFNAHFPKEKQDKRLPEKLRDELPGVLAWIAKGAARWYADGLGDAAKVVEATASYREEQDTLAQFVKDRCRVGPQEQVGAEALYQAFREWCAHNGEKPLANKVYGVKLKERGFVSDRNARERFWRGIGLVPPLFDRRESDG